MRKRSFLTALGSIAALAMLILAFPTSATAATTGPISNPMQTHCLQPENKSARVGVLILQAECDGSDAQRWARLGLHYVNLGTGLCLDANGPREVGHPLTVQSICTG